MIAKEIKDRLFLRVINAEKNAEALQNMPHKRIADLAVVYTLVVGSSDRGMLCANLSDENLKNMGISPAELEKCSFMNAPKICPPVIEPILTHMAKMACCDEEEFTATKASKLLVVTNEGNVNGASALFYPGVLDRIAEMFGDRFYILPSSIHEFLVTPTGPADGLREIVRSVNASVVNETDWLSDNIYVYDSHEKAFKIEEEK